jgi:hypothetical protein
MRNKALNRLFVGYMMCLYFPTMFAIIVLIKGLSEFVNFSFDPEFSFFTLIVLPAFLDLIALSIWFKFEFNYVPPLKNLFLAISVVSSFIVVGDILYGALKLHHLMIPLTFYILSRVTTDSANFKAVSKLVAVFSIPFALGYISNAIILHTCFFQALLWLLVLVFFGWTSLKIHR